MENFLPGDFGETPAGNDRKDPPPQKCPHCQKIIKSPSLICPHCSLPLDRPFQMELSPKLPRQSWRRLLRPQTIILAVVMVAAVLGIYGFFVIQRLSSDYYITTGDRLMTEGDDTAIEYYRQAVQLGPQNPEALERLGWAEYQLALDTDALQHFEKTLALDPDRLMSLYGAGLSAYQLRDYEGSSSYLNRVIEITPGHVGAYEYLGLAEYRLGKYDLAYKHLNRAWIYNPQNGTTIYYLARILAQRGQASLAIENFNQAEKLGFDPTPIAFARGLAWMQTGNYEFARDDLQKALVASPTRMDVSLSLAKAFYLLGDYTAAKTQLSTLQADVPPILQSDYLALSGWTSLRQGDTTTARDTFNLWLNLNPNNDQALNAFGWAAFHSGDCQTAKKYFESAIQSMQGEWMVNNDSLAAPDETPQTGLEAQCQ
jgi:tetratricopeptide (TPR) repeat protein